MSSTWIIITNESPYGGLVATAKKSGTTVNAVVVGCQELAEKVAKSGVDSLLFVETKDLPEAKAQIIAKAAKEANPKAVLSAPAPGARAIAGAVANALEAVVVPGVTGLKIDGNTVNVEQEALRGRVLDTLTSEKALVGFFVGEDVEVATDGTAEIKKLDGEGYSMTVEIQSTGSGDSGLLDATKVISVGRGLKSKDDLAIVEELAAVMGAEISCSMPVADDLGWVAKDHYVGRSGQKIAPRIYLTLGISGAPQHLEGVRGAKIIAAINNDPEARIFRAADYGIVGDLYEIIPALKDALNN